MHPKYLNADHLSREVIGAGIEVHRVMGPGLLETIYQKFEQKVAETAKEFYTVQVLLSGARVTSI